MARHGAAADVDAQAQVERQDPGEWRMHVDRATTFISANAGIQIQLAGLFFSAAAVSLTVSDRYFGFAALYVIPTVSVFLLLVMSPYYSYYSAQLEYLIDVGQRCPDRRVGSRGEWQARMPPLPVHRHLMIAVRELASCRNPYLWIFFAYFATPHASFRVGLLSEDAGGDFHARLPATAFLAAHDGAIHAAFLLTQLLIFRRATYMAFQAMQHRLYRHRPVVARNVALGVAVEGLLALGLGALLVYLLGRASGGTL